MNLFEALKSGKYFRRKSSVKGLANYWEKDELYSGISSGWNGVFFILDIPLKHFPDHYPERQISEEDILADDYEVKE